MSDTTHEWIARAPHPATCIALARRFLLDGVELERAEQLAERAVRLAPGEAAQQILSRVRERRAEGASANRSGSSRSSVELRTA